MFKNFIHTKLDKHACRQKLRRSGLLTLKEKEDLPSKKTLAVILAVVIIALTTVDYQLYHRGLVAPARFGFHFSPPFTPDITIPALASAAQNEQTEPSNMSNPSSRVVITSSSSDASTQSAGILKIGIYNNNPSSNTPQPLEAIDWSAKGVIIPGQRVNSSRVYVRNEGTTSAKLIFSTSDWIFEDAGGKLSGNYSTYFALTWDYDNSSISVNETRPLTFSLVISPSISNVSMFSFNLDITYY